VSAQSGLRRVSAVPAKPKISPLCWQLSRYATAQRSSGQAAWVLRRVERRSEPLRRP